MKFAALPFCAIAFTVLSIAQVVLTHFHLINLGPIWLVLTAYSAVIAVAAWGDQHAKQQPFVNFGGASDRFAQSWNGWKPDAGVPQVFPVDDLSEHLIFGETRNGMTSSFNHKA